MIDLPFIELQKLLPTKEIYQDLAKPAVRSTGKALREVAEIVRASTRPLRSVRIAWETVFDNLDTWLIEKLRRTPKNEIVPPLLSIAGPVVSGLVYVQDEVVLRDMFVTLLASGMRRSTKSAVHPAYVEILKQLSSHDAALLREVSAKSTVGLLTVRAHKPWTKESFKGRFRRKMTDREWLNELNQNPETPYNYQFRITDFDVQAPKSAEPSITSLENLKRLQLVEFEEATFNDKLYLPLLHSAINRRICKEVIRLGRRPGYWPGIIRSTEFCERFAAVCF